LVSYVFPTAQHLLDLFLISLGHVIPLTHQILKATLLVALDEKRGNVINDGTSILTPPVVLVAGALVVSDYSYSYDGGGSAGGDSGQP
jgi:hypothetical protein